MTPVIINIILNSVCEATILVVPVLAFLAGLVYLYKTEA